MIFKNYKSILIFNAFYILVIQNLIFNILNAKFEHVLNIELIKILFFILICSTYSICFFKKVKVNNYMKILIFQIIIANILFIGILPKYTYNQAIQLIKENYKYTESDILIREPINRKILENKYGIIKYNYLISFKKDGITKTYDFNPSKGYFRDLKE